MFSQFRAQQFATYTKAHAYFTANPNILIALEEELTNHLVSILRSNLAEIRRDYNEASYLYPFWQEYPPDDRGRQPVGDQYPWIEVGEHAVGAKLPRFLAKDFDVSDPGLPTGADQRFVLRSATIEKLTKSFTNAAWLFIDIKSVGPRDDQDHTVMSHNQVSGDGIWLKQTDGVRNTIVKAHGSRTFHDFHCGIPPLYVLSDNTVTPTVIVAIKPVYQMISSGGTGRNQGQPLDRIDVACIPNGILLAKNPSYLKSHKGLLFPGKDDKSKKATKLRARVSFDLLRQIAPWRHQIVR
jgi:hypothetical protein